MMEEDEILVEMAALSVEDEEDNGLVFEEEIVGQDMQDFSYAL